jgi:hypothetical protein
MASLGGTKAAEARAGDKPAAPLVKETTTATFREEVLTDSLRRASS